jgi:outer membrane protein OmpA-like peptidoglycan-associated protein
VHDSTEPFATEASPTRRYFLVALLLALGVHAAFLGISRYTNVETISPSYFNKLVPRTFTVKKVEIDPATLDQPDPAPTPRQPPKPITDISALQIGTKDKTFEDALATADQVIAAPEVLDKGIVKEKPALAPSESLTKALSEPPKPAAPIAGEPGSLLDQLAEKKPAVPGRPLIEMKAGPPGAGNGGVDAPAPGEGNFSSLDGLLSAGGGVGDRTAPILLPTDLLFDYDRAELRPEALDSLRKLGQLILKNPNADFTIEGHTDTFGSPGYNRTLSERRAISVKAWLVSDMQIDPNRIQTRGFGSSRPLAPVTGSVDEQRLNRRVEIVIKTRRR